MVQADHSNKNPLDKMAERFQSPGAIITLGITMVLFFMAAAAVEYSIRFVATNLAIVEATDDAGRIALTSSEPDAPLHKAPLLDDFDGEDQKLPIPEAALPAQPITRKLRTTFQHLHSVGGFRSRFRGLRFAAFYSIVTAFFSVLFQAVFSFAGPVGFWLATTTAAVLCCNVHAAWTHATIAAPTEKRFFQRFLPRSVAKSLMLPTLRLHIAIGMAHVATVGTAALAVNSVHDNRVPKWLSANMFFLPIAVALLTGFFTVLPAYIALVRTEASLLPEDMSAIVPFDRTFGGRMEVREGASKACAFFKAASMRGAYMMFGRETFRRVAKMQVKFLAVSLALTVSLAAVFAAEAFVIAGGEKNIREFIKYAHEHMA